MRIFSIFKLSDRTPFFIALVLSIICFALPMCTYLVMPFGWLFYAVLHTVIVLLLYPITLFTTFIHEGGHAITALLTGSEVTGMSVHLDGSGLTGILSSSKFSSILIGNAGYLSEAIYGAIVLILANRGGNLRNILRFSAIFVGSAVVLFTIFAKGWFFTATHGNSNISIGMSLFTACIGGVIVYGTWRLSSIQNELKLAVLVNFIAIECLLNAVNDLQNLFFTGEKTDATHLYELTGIPGFFWVCLWATISFFIIKYAYRLSMSQETRS